MNYQDFTRCEFIDEYLRFTTYDDFCENCRAIKEYYKLLDFDDKRFYKWYVYANIFMDEDKKNIIWNFLNCELADSEDDD